MRNKLFKKKLTKSENPERVVTFLKEFKTYICVLTKNQ